VKQKQLALKKTEKEGDGQANLVFLKIKKGYN